MKFGRRESDKGVRVGDGAGLCVLLNGLTPGPSRLSAHRAGGVGGFTLIELVTTATVLAILTLGVMPLVKVSFKRQREQELRERLREIRTAIDQFHREAIAAPLTNPGGVQTQGPSGQQGLTPPGIINQRPGPGFVDPRIRVFISDQKIFTVDNPDRYPPDLDTLVKGVDVMPFASAAGGLGGGRGVAGVDALEAAKEEAVTAKTKVYLRSVPIDPMTGKADWNLRSLYDTPDASSWGGQNVFNVNSKSTATALNGEKYSDW
jgi:general secretion pathway protein G